MQAVLQQLDRPLLCSSIRPLDVLSGALDDGAVLLDQYAPRGLDYVVDNGVRYGEGSSVVDMTVRTLLLLRSLCLAPHEHTALAVPSVAERVWRWQLRRRSTRHKCCEVVPAT